MRTVQFPTASPEATVNQAVAFFLQQGRLDALGIGSFGPVDLSSGHITSTPKPGWQNYDLAGALRRRLNLPVGFDTDVNAAALGEARWGAGQGLSDFLYLTVGTGIGGGALVNGRLVHGRMRSGDGNIRVPHDRARDPFPGCCPYHGDCLEGLASGPAMEARWGCPAETLASGHPAWDLEAHYLALALNNWSCVLAPQRIVLGGGVMEQPELLDRIGTELAHLLNGYIATPELSRPQLGTRSGVLGALVLAERAIES